MCNSTNKLSDYAYNTKYSASDLYPSDYVGMARVWLEYLESSHPDLVDQMQTIAGVCLGRNCFSDQHLRIVIGEMADGDADEAEPFIDDAVEFINTFDGCKRDPFFDLTGDALRDAVENYYWYRRVTNHYDSDPVDFVITMRNELADAPAAAYEA